MLTSLLRSAAEASEAPQDARHLAEGSQPARAIHVASGPRVQRTLSSGKRQRQHCVSSSLSATVHHDDGDTPAADDKGLLAQADAAYDAATCQLSHSTKRRPAHWHERPGSEPYCSGRSPGVSSVAAVPTTDASHLGPRPALSSIFDSMGNETSCEPSISGLASCGRRERGSAPDLSKEALAASVSHAAAISEVQEYLEAASVSFRPSRKRDDNTRAHLALASSAENVPRSVTDTHPPPGVDREFVSSRGGGSQAGPSGCKPVPSSIQPHARTAVSQTDIRGFLQPKPRMPGETLRHSSPSLTRDIPKMKGCPINIERLALGKDGIASPYGNALGDLDELVSPGEHGGSQFIPSPPLTSRDSSSCKSPRHFAQEEELKGKGHSQANLQRSCSLPNPATVFPIFKRYSKTIYLIRHGESEYNAADARKFSKFEDPMLFDAPLTPKGLAQARRLGPKLRELPCENLVYVTSPLTRAVQTCLVGLEAAGLQVIHPSASAAIGQNQSQHSTATVPCYVNAHLREHLATSGDVGRPRSVIQKAFPQLETQMGEIEEEHWWWEPGKNDADAKKFSSYEPKASLRKRIGLFRQWVFSLPEEITVVAVGHSTFFKELQKEGGGKKPIILANGEMIKIQL